MRAGSKLEFRAVRVELMTTSVCTELNLSPSRLPLTDISIELKLCALCSIPARVRQLRRPWNAK
jgi:hypothetical protein